MCYYKLDYYDVSLEILAVYLQSHPESPIGVNLKACNHFRLYNGKAAEAELKFLSDKGINIQSNELVRHNMVVFSNGEQALQVLPGLVDSIPEARLNLVSRTMYVWRALFPVSISKIRLVFGGSLFSYVFLMLYIYAFCCRCFSTAAALRSSTTCATARSTRPSTW
jgi:hypothetical protein